MRRPSAKNDTVTHLMQEIPPMNKTRRLTRIAITTALLLAPLAVLHAAEPKLASVFSDHAILQRDASVPIWGWAGPGDEVTVEFAGQKKTAKADAAGRWLVKLDPLAASTEPRPLKVNSLVMKDVLVGDVWVCGGQSNMERTLFNFRTDAAIAWETAMANYPLIRQVTVSQTTSLVPLQDPALAQGWTQCSPATAGGFSATGYFFAKNVYLQTGVPVGLLFSAWGAKEIQRFLAPEGVAAIPELSGLFQFVAGGGSTSSFPYYDIYNAMIAPLIPYGVKGAIWYQGEWNSGDGDFYHQSMRALIAGWRKNWGQGNFPFYYVQLPNYNDAGYPSVREAQLHTLSETNTGMAVTIDTGDGQLHPADKPDVGYRLAQWALAKDDGQNIPYSGPLISGVTNEGGQLRISFNYVGGGLMAGYKFTNNPVVPVSGIPLDDFQVAGADKVFAAAVATIQSNTVVVSNAAVTAPVYVRYCYVGWPAGTNRLYNVAGLPASPFRTDVDYPLTVQSGSGGNSAVIPGALQTITANAAPAGMVFDRWIGAASGVDNLNAANATVTMPLHALFLLAAYRSNSTPAYTLTVNQGFGSGTSQAGNYLNLEAQPAATGWAFDHWSGNTQTVANVLAPFTTLQMPASNVTVTAIYVPLLSLQISISGMTNVLLTGTGGLRTGSTYYWLRRSTNLTLPLTNWSVVSTDLFNADGSFSNSLKVTPGMAQEFYRIQTP